MAELVILLTDNGRLNHKAVNHPASSLAQDMESLPAKTSVLTTMLRRHLSKDIQHPAKIVPMDWLKSHFERGHIRTFATMECTILRGLEKSKIQLLASYLHYSLDLGFRSC